MSALFHHEAVVVPLGSGSRGNATYVGDGRRGVLIDCGLSTRQIFRRLDAVGLGATRIEAVLITHEHADHVGAARVLDSRLYAAQGERVPFFMTHGTAAALHPNCRPVEIAPVRPGQRFELGGGRPLGVEVVTVPHDTRDPVSFTVTVGSARAGVITDLGRSTRLVEQQLASLDIAVVEFNHDLQMLMDGSYPWALKQRVRGPHGHLSNQQAADLVRAAAGTRLRHLFLAHLSEENNRPDLALESAHQALHAAGRGSVAVHVAPQEEPAVPARVASAAEDTDPLASVARSVAAQRRRAPAKPAPPDASRQITLF